MDKATELKAQMLAQIDTITRDAWRIVDTGRPYHYGIIRAVKTGKARAAVFGDDRRTVLVCAATIDLIESPAINAAIRDKVENRPCSQRSLAWPHHERRRTP
jgi:hypothetical protein